MSLGYEKRPAKNVISTLQTESQAEIEWFKLNERVVNPKKFPTIVVKKVLK